MRKIQMVDLQTQYERIKQDINAGIQEVIDTVNEYGDINDSLEALIHSVNLKFGENEREAFLYVPTETENFGDYVAFRDRVTNEEYALPEEGAVITEKTANMLGLSVGDVVEICEGDAEGVKVQVVNIIENYIMHYLFISPATYERIYGEKVEPDSLLLLYDHKTEEEEAELGRLVLALPGCSGYDTVTELEATIDDMLEVLNVIVWVLIISAGLLAFVVLYNLNSINITERKRIEMEIEEPSGLHWHPGCNADITVCDVFKKRHDLVFFSDLKCYGTVVWCTHRGEALNKISVTACEQRGNVIRISNCHFFLRTVCQQMGEQTGGSSPEAVTH